MNWLLSDAKNRFSALVNLALTTGPQRVQRRHDAVIVLAEKDYQRLCGSPPSFKDFLIQGPDFDGLDLTRDISASRPVEL